MLHWTSAGAVGAPRVVQIRVTRHYPDRVRAGAPQPARSLSDAEVRENIHYFVVERRGPRTVASDALVLSGVALAARGGLAHVVAEARTWGLQRVTLHLGAGARGDLLASPLGREVDALACGVSDVQDLADVGVLTTAPTGRPFHVSAVVTLDANGLARLEDLSRGLARVRPQRVVLTWPLVGPDRPPAPARVLIELRTAVSRLEDAGVETVIKGLPLCKLDELRDRAGRTGNRWYVDAAHQRERALLFLPHVIRLEKADMCRFCAASVDCDGVPEAWLRSGDVGPLAPIR